MEWKELKTNKAPLNTSLLCLRKGNRVCNLYFDGKNWKDDGYDSRSERNFDDVTHWIGLKDIPLPNSI